MSLRLFQRDHVKRSQWRRPRLCRYHPSEARDIPCASMVVLSTHRHQVFLAQHYPDHWAAVYCEGLEELRSVPYCLWVLDYDTDGTGTSAICNLDPVSTET